MMNRARKIQFHEIQQSPVDICLEIWAESMRRDDRDLGIQSLRSLAGGDGYGNDETAQSRRDNEIAAATGAMIDGLRMHHRWAISKCYQICQVWRFDRLDYYQTLEEAKLLLAEKLKKNIATRLMF